MKIVLVLSFALLVAGCVNGPASPADEDRSKPTDAGGTPPPATRPDGTPNSPIDGEGLQIAVRGVLLLDGCVWLQTITDYYLGTNPAPLPPGWSPDDTAPFSTNVLRLYQCASAALDELDRPASLLIETSNAGREPEKCREPDLNVSFLTNLYTDDEALAEVLSTRYHAPARLATFSVHTDDTGTAWTWNQGGGSSEMTYPVGNVVEDEEVRLTPNRIIWITPNGTNTLEAEYRPIGPSIGRAAYGTLSDHHYLGAQGLFAGPAGAGPELSMRAPINPRGPLCEPLDA